MEQKKLYLSDTDKKICGVCGGVAEYFNIDSTLVRVIYLVLLLCGSAGFWAYIVCALVIPHKPIDMQ